VEERMVKRDKGVWRKGWSLEIKVCGGKPGGENANSSQKSFLESPRSGFKKNEVSFTTSM
jgi:hypothetical protein